MKIFLSVVLVLHLVAETLAGLALLAGPEGVLAGAVDTDRFQMHYGFAALALAGATAWVWSERYNRAVITPVLGTLLSFHIGLFISLTISADQVPGQILHAVMSVLFGIAFFQRGKLSN